MGLIHSKSLHQERLFRTKVGNISNKSNDEKIDSSSRDADEVLQLTEKGRSEKWLLTGTDSKPLTFIYCYNSMSLASSSEKSDIELSEEEERSSSPPHASLKASSVAYFLTYSATFFLYSSGL